MIETYSPELITEFLNGKASDLPAMTRLMAQSFFVLLAGIVIWRVSVAFGKPKQISNRKKFVRSKYKDHWYK
jgi:hypothetical protein